MPIVVNQLPSVTLTSPAAGATFAAPATISLAATASDPDGTITEVRFYNGASLLGTDTTSPHAFTWASVPANAYSLTAVAVDNRGATRTSSPVNVTVCGLPGVTIASPIGGTYAAPATISLAANASSACGIQKVEFYDGATLIATDTTSPFAHTWSNVTVPGAHVVKARAYDNLGRFAESQTTIQIVNNAPPVINSVTPTAAQVVAGSSVSFVVVVTDADSGNTLTVSLWNGATQLATLGPVGPGTHTLSWTVATAGNLQPHGEGRGSIRDDVTGRHRRGDLAPHLRTAQSRCGDSRELSDACDRHACRQIRGRRIRLRDVLDPVEGRAGDRGPGAGAFARLLEPGKLRAARRGIQPGRAIRSSRDAA